jgi:hypothetical protein
LGKLVGRIVGLVIGESAARPALVQRSVTVAGRPEPKLDLLTVLELPGHTEDSPNLAPVVFYNVSHLDGRDRSGGLRWKYAELDLLTQDPFKMSTGAAK